MAFLIWPDHLFDSSVMVLVTAAIFVDAVVSISPSFEDTSVEAVLSLSDMVVGHVDAWFVTVVDILASLVEKVVSISPSLDVTSVDAVFSLSLIWFLAYSN